MTKAYSIFLTVLFTVFIGGVLVISALLPKDCLLYTSDAADD